MKIRVSLLSLYARLFARPQLQVINRILFKLSLHGMGILNFYNNEISGERSFIRRYISGLKSPVIFDVGANEGAYSEDILRENPSARLFAFEPHPEAFQRLPKNGITTINAACGSSSGNLTLYDYISGMSQHASLYRGVITDHHGSEPKSISVPVVTIDEFARVNSIEKIDFLKIDTEGNELEVLRGAQGLISQKKVEVILFEFNAPNVYSRTFFKDIYEFLSDYKLFRLLPSHLLPIDKYSEVSCEIFAFQNIVAFLRHD